ncbi:MAG TPA: LPS export ABC transporter permease LptG [Gammaproteobacteria bacterium]|nr:LPS export ABC transporter permease LptG [Gammaproteobacteria bacterium]
MIYILPRYIAKTVILATLLVMLVVLGLAFFINLLSELRDVGVGDYGLLQAAMHAFLELPYNIYVFFPMLVLLGGLLGLSMLASHQELIVMRASGVSIRKIMMAVFTAAVVLIAIGMMIGEIIAPRAHYLADVHKSTEQSGGQAVITAAGLWVHEGNSFVHIDRVMAHRHLEGVTRYEFDNNHQLLAAYFAKTMDYRDGHWKLHDLAKTTFTLDHTRSEQLADATWDLTLNPNVLSIGLLEPEEMPLTQLSSFMRHLTKNGLQATEFQFSFWKRILQPLTILVMLFLAVPFVFTAPRSINLGLQMLLGVVTGFVFYIMNSMLGQLSIVYQLPPFFAALLPILVFAGLGYFLMLRVKL